MFNSFLRSPSLRKGGRDDAHGHRAEEASAAVARLAVDVPVEREELNAANDHMVWPRPSAGALEIAARPPDLRPRKPAPKLPGSPLVFS